MIAKQYSIALPADYDMGIIRRRVAAAAPRFDAFPGLSWKAFLIRERGRNGAVGNAYAPFYIWPDTQSLWDFVAGDGFKGIVASFGWHPIRTWLPWSVVTRPGMAARARIATCEEGGPIMPNENLQAMRRAEAATNQYLLERDPTLQARVVAVDIERWTLLRVSLWDVPDDAYQQAPGLDVFEVLHVSAPGLA